MCPGRMSYEGGDGGRGAGVVMCVESVCMGVGKRDQEREDFLDV